MMWRRAAPWMGMLVLAGAAFTLSLHTGLLSPTPSRMLVDRHGDYLGEVPGLSLIHI